MNSVSLVGRLTKDPDMRGEGKYLCARFTLAVRRIYGEDTDFIRCAAFGKCAELIEQYVSKGNKLGLVGRIQTGSYVNRDGQKIYTTEVVAETIDLLESRPKVITEYVERVPDEMPF